MSDLKKIIKEEYNKKKSKVTKDLIIEMIEEWPHNRKFSWPEIAKAFKKDSGRKVSIPTLCDPKKPIHRAYADKKDLIKKLPGHQEKQSKNLPSLKIASSRIESRDLKIAQLEKENARLMEQFHTWLYNANTHGVTIEMLNLPLPRVTKK